MVIQCKLIRGYQKGLRKFWTCHNQILSRVLSSNLTALNIVSTLSLHGTIFTFIYCIEVFRTETFSMIIRHLNTRLLNLCTINLNTIARCPQLALTE